jgi:anti-anti-sigma regulatory factor
VPDRAVLAPGATAGRTPWCSRWRFDCARVVRLCVPGQLEIATTPRLDQALGCAQAEAAPVTFGLRELEFGDSSGADRIAAASGRVRQAGGWAVVARGLVDVERLCALVGLDRQQELVDHPPATPPARVPDGVSP